MVYLPTQTCPSPSPEPGFGGAFWNALVEVCPASLNPYKCWFASRYIKVPLKNRKPRNASCTRLFVMLIGVQPEYTSDPGPELASGLNVARNEQLSCSYVRSVTGNVGSEKRLPATVTLCSDASWTCVSSI